VVVPPLRRVAVQWEELTTAEIKLPDGARFAVVAVAPKDKREGLPEYVDKWAKPKGFKPLPYQVADLPKVVKLYTLDPAAAPEAAKRLGCDNPPQTAYLSAGGSVMLLEPGIPRQSEPTAFLTSLQALEGMTPAKRIELDKLAFELATALSKLGMNEQAAAAGALRTGLAQQEFDALAASEKSLGAMAVRAAEGASNGARLAAACGDAEGALDTVSKLEKLFERVGAAKGTLAAVREGVTKGDVGTVLCDWPYGAAVGVAYYTGKGAQYLKAFEDVGRAVAKDLGLPYIDIHAAEVLGGADDPNGALLWPDGTARVRLLIMPGGQAHDTWLELGGKDGDPKCAGRELFQKAFATGMNYIGCCGGCFMGSGNFDDTPNAFNSHLTLWPGQVRLGLGKPGRQDQPPGMVFEPGHPLTAASQNGELKAVFFNGGPQWLQPDFPGTEYVAKFRGGGLQALWGNWALIAYSPPGNAGGRIVACAAHPEVKYNSFVKAMAAYAIDHRYALPRNPIEPGKSLRATSGDGQLQFYEVKVGDGAARLDVALSGATGDCDLYARRAGLPGAAAADARSATKGTGDEKLSIQRPKAGLWFIAVHGNHDVKAGVEYTLDVKIE